MLLETVRDFIRAELAPLEYEVEAAGPLEQHAGDEMGGWAHGGVLSLDAAVRIEGADRAGRERLLRYCARPPFVLEHSHQHDAEHLIYAIPKPHPDGPRAVVLTPLDLLDKIAALVSIPARPLPPLLRSTGAGRTVARRRPRAGASARAGTGRRHGKAGAG